MKCVICEGKTTKKSVDYEEFGISLGRFDADVCKKCGEAYFDEKTAGTIQQKSKQLGLFGLSRKTKIAEVGNSIAIRIPKDIATFLGLKKGVEVIEITQDLDTKQDKPKWVYLTEEQVKTLADGAKYDYKVLILMNYQ